MDYTTKNVGLKANSLDSFWWNKEAEQVVQTWHPGACCGPAEPTFAFLPHPIIWPWAFQACSAWLGRGAEASSAHPSPSWNTPMVSAEIICLTSIHQRRGRGVCLEPVRADHTVVRSQLCVGKKQRGHNRIWCTELTRWNHAQTRDAISNLLWRPVWADAANRKRRRPPSTNTEMTMYDGVEQVCSRKIRGQTSAVVLFHGAFARSASSDAAPVFPADTTASVRRSDAHSTITNKPMCRKMLYGLQRGHTRTVPARRTHTEKFKSHRLDSYLVIKCVAMFLDLLKPGG